MPNHTDPTITSPELAATIAVSLDKAAHGEALEPRHSEVMSIKSEPDEHGLSKRVKIKEVFWTTGGGVNVYLENGQTFALAIVPGKITEGSE